MAELRILHYQPGESWLHRHHPGAKFLEFLGINIVLVLLPLWSSALFLIPLVVLFPFVGFDRKTFTSLGIAVVSMMVFFICIGMLSVEGVWFSLSGWNVGVLQGLRFITLTLWAVLFLGVTDPWDIAGCIGSLGRGRVKLFSYLGFAIALVLSFFPMLLDRALEQGEALRNRGLTFRNPIRYCAFLGSKLVISVELLADDLSMAIESRCYRPDRAWGIPRWKVVDIVGVFTVWIVLGVLFIIFP